MRTLVIALLAVFAVGCQPPPGVETPVAADKAATPAETTTEAVPEASTWRAELDAYLPKLGHRNWIVVADSAYPWQISPGVHTVVTGADQLEVLQAVLEAVKAAPHVQPEIFIDSELQFVPEAEAAGIGAYREALPALFGDATVVRLKHEEIIAKLDRVGATYKVLLLKTNMTLPYTSVFLQLNAGYWGPTQEAKLRDLIKSGGTAPKPADEAVNL